jgi:multicomponent Na+:H+ antiporter subunit G
MTTSILDAVTVFFIVMGAFFFLAGTAGLLRFPDAPSRLHALTKADNLALGFVIIGLAAQAASPPAMVKLLVIWMAALLASSTIAQLIAYFARTEPPDNKLGGDA